MNYMNIAFKESLKALKNKDVPIGAVIVNNNKIIAKGYNKKEKFNNSLMHAEIIAINKACKKLKTKNLSGCSIYVTLEPCMMCYYAITESKIDQIFYMIESDYNNTIVNKGNKIVKTKVNDEYNYIKILKEFFRLLR